jgi:beta-hydroxylase
MSLRKRYRTLGPRGFARWLLLKRVGKLSFRRIDEFLAGQSLVGDPPVFDTRQFPWVAALEADWKRVREELDRLLEHRNLLPSLQEIQPDQKKVSPDDQWKTFVLYGYGYRSERGCARCPETAALLERVPGLSSAWFSILAPGKHIPRHAGITKAIIRCHLALKVPRQADRVRMQVGDQMCSWEEGRCLLFDDSRKHEVWNDSGEERVVLIFDVARPMRWKGRLLARIQSWVLRRSPFVRDARRNQLAWEDRILGALETSPDAAAVSH